MMNLSEHFTLDEFTHSQVAIRIGASNDPPLELLPNLKRTAQGLEAVRELLGGLPVHVSSGYRSEELEKLITHKSYIAWCAKKKIAVNDDSWVKYFNEKSHPKGQAVDFTCPAFGTPEQIMRRIVSSGIEYDQCLLEFNSWVHISFNDKPRRQALVIDRSGTRVYK